MIDTPERILSDARQAIDWAIRSEMVPPMINPCQVTNGKLGDLLPLDRAEGGHEPAIPPKRMPLFFKALMELVPTSPSARCLAFAILTAARNSTAREATWGEIQQDDDGNWLHVIPRARMKVKAEKIPFDRARRLFVVRRLNYWLIRRASRVTRTGSYSRTSQRAAGPPIPET